MGTRMLHVRVEEEVKERASIALEQMGLTMSEAVRVFLHRVAADQKLPFALEVPNARTRAAMEEARSLSARFDTPAALLDDLDGGQR
ncbi:type II toxin-antitoxin system RelB/DinJ family antitoxin [Falsiroseomonas ponticola]|uniref:type II toxin-antitoxin system RelB/DinJ family antitoxin n=1 Tax=Falsiroseomonas ponticola TaxID=2786951 RepID=UPI001934137B|nr:type II toxin-antitoxin system RelB/DinJ family antitoxin [Roseomonas ponticola]